MDMKTLLSNQWIKEKIKGDRKKFLETNGNRNTAYQNWDKAKAVLIEKSIAIYAYFKHKSYMYI